MTEASPQSSRSAWRERVQALKNVPPVLGILWESGPAVVVWGIILRVLVAAAARGDCLRRGIDHQRRAARISATKGFCPTFGGWWGWKQASTCSTGC